MVLIKRFVLLIFLVFSIGAYALQDYEAVYGIRVKGISVGEMHQSAHFYNGESYLLKGRAEPGKLAQLVGYNAITEEAAGEIKGNKVIPTRYERAMEKHPEEKVSIRYYPEKYKIDSYAEEEEKQLSYDSSQQPLDSLALIVQTLLNVRYQHSMEKICLITRNKIREYDVYKRDKEILKDENGQSVSVYVFEQNSKNRQTIIYMADNPLRVLKLKQLKDGKNQFELNLLQYKVL